MTRNFHPKGLWLHCKDHLKWLINLFYRILVTCSLFKIFNFVSYANITSVRSHHIMSFQKSIVFLTNTYLNNLKIALVYVLRMPFNLIRMISACHRFKSAQRSLGNDNCAPRLNGILVVYIIYVSHIHHLIVGCINTFRMKSSLSATLR
jgi:hypothetical protein